MKEGADSIEPVTKRLDVIVRLLLDSWQQGGEKKTTREKLIFLEGAGLSPSEAARILGINPHQLTSYRRTRGQDHATGIDSGA